MAGGGETRLFRLGFFDPMRQAEALQCLQMMDFEDKDTVLQQVAQNGGLQEKMQLLGQYAQALAEKHGDEVAVVQLAEITGMQRKPQKKGKAEKPEPEERAEVRKARQKTAEAAVPEE